MKTEQPNPQRNLELASALAEQLKTHATNTHDVIRALLAAQGVDKQRS